MDDNPKVLQLDEYRAEAPPVRRTHRSGACIHSKHPVLVDPSARTVECGNCGTLLDPIAALMRMVEYADRWERLTESIQQKRDELSRLADEERRVKARVRSAKRRQSGG